MYENGEFRYSETIFFLFSDKGRNSFRKFSYSCDYYGLLFPNLNAQGIIVGNNSKFECTFWNNVCV